MPKDNLIPLPTKEDLKDRIIELCQKALLEHFEYLKTLQDLTVMIERYKGKHWSEWR